VLRDHPKEALPHEAALLYHEFAKERLSVAAAGEQTGSMALYGIGKVYTRMAERRDDDVECVRSATTMYAAALAACPENHLAANELGVMLCKAGRSKEAVDQFQRTIDASPTATAYHNLAVAQQKAGLREAAAANELQSQRLAAWERSTNAVSRRAQIEWMSPAEMAAVGQPNQWEPSPSSALNRAAPAHGSAAPVNDTATRPLIFPSVMPGRTKLR
jgi:tetratricopeptide (TPR) repeat protein